MQIPKPVVGVLALLSFLGVMSIVSDALVILQDDRAAKFQEKERIRAAVRQSKASRVG